jgi:hypothetical protein
MPHLKEHEALKPCTTGKSVEDIPEVSAQCVLPIGFSGVPPESSRDSQAIYVSANILQHDGKPEASAEKDF